MITPFPGTRRSHACRYALTAPGRGDAAAGHGARRLTTIKHWLVELKSMLPDHAAYAVSCGLDDWCAWAAAPRALADWRNAQPEMRMPAAT